MRVAALLAPGSLPTSYNAAKWRHFSTDPGHDRVLSGVPRRRKSSAMTAGMDTAPRRICHFATMHYLQTVISVIRRMRRMQKLRLAPKSNVFNQPRERSGLPRWPSVRRRLQIGAEVANCPPSATFYLQQ